MKDQSNYVREVLRLYLVLPDSPTHAKVSDYNLAERLFDQGITLEEVESALLLGTARRLFGREDRGRSLGVHSLRYFIPIIMEITEGCFSDDYLEYLRRNVRPYLKPINTLYSEFKDHF
jgi:hypothetical protein